MSVISFIKDLRLLELVTDQIWISFAIWCLFIYLALSQDFGWLTSLVLIIGGALLNLLALIKWFRQNKTTKTKTMLRLNKPASR